MNQTCAMDALFSSRCQTIAAPRGSMSLAFGTCSGAQLYGCALQALLAGTRQTRGVARLRRAAWAVQPANICRRCSAAAPQSYHVMAAAPLTWHRATTQRTRWAVGATEHCQRAHFTGGVVVMHCCSAGLPQSGPCCIGKLRQLASCCTCSYKFDHPSNSIRSCRYH
jgi:hypothetical protein